MGRAEISWKRRSAEGTRTEIYAKKTGGHWVFYQREKRYDSWEPLEHPALDDWLELLEAVQRRVQRLLLTPEDEARLRRMIIERYPGALNSNAR